MEENKKDVATTNEQRENNVKKPVSTKKNTKKKKNTKYNLNYILYNSYSNHLIYSSIFYKNS